MKKNIGKFVLLLMMIPGLTACDDGEIPRKTYTATTEGLTAKLTGTITGTGGWPDYYQVALAAFDDQSEYSLTQVLVSPEADGTVNLTLSGISTDAQTIELCITNKLRKRILTLAETQTTQAQGDTIYLQADNVDAAMYSAIQTEIFNTTCAQCHGGSTTAAANLYLTQGNSYASLVNQPSTTTQDATRVIPGNSDESVLHLAINAGNELNLGYNHEYLITSSAMLRLIDEWIDNGAQEN